MRHALCTVLFSTLAATAPGIVTFTVGRNLKSRPEFMEHQGFESEQDSSQEKVR